MHSDRLFPQNQINTQYVKRATKWESEWSIKRIHSIWVNEQTNESTTVDDQTEK